MPIKIPGSLPAHKILQSENVFVMTEQRANMQDIRPLKILILNLMPTKIETETQLLRLLGNSPLQVEIELLKTASHNSKNTSYIHLESFYRTYDDICQNKYDGMIITGAPVEQLDFEQVDYWPELCTIMDWTRSNVYSTLHICWGAQAALYHHFGIDKYPLSPKLSGVFEHRLLNSTHPLMRGFNDRFMIPHSRNTSVRASDIVRHDELEILADSIKTGPAIIAHKSGRQFFCTGHAEYDRHTLSTEYYRDLRNGLEPKVPENYFPGDNPASLPLFTWRSHANLLFSNWLNYYVYQQTPYNLNELKHI